MKRKITIIVFLLFISTYKINNAQNFRRIIKNFGIEVGIGSNELIFKSGASELRRDNFTFAPTVRIYYEHSFFGIIRLKPFFGYTEYGGNSRVEPNGYQDKISFHSFEYGSFVSVNLMVLGLSGSIGLKGKTFFSANQSSYGSIADPPGTERQWIDSDPSILYKKTSYNFGIRINQGIGKLTFGVEGWFGISDLRNEEIYKGSDVTIFENHYRLVFSYKF